MLSRLRSFFDRLSSRQNRLLYGTVIVMALVVSGINFADIMFLKVTSNDQCAWRPVKGDSTRLLITDVVPGGVADRAGIRNGDYLLKIDGREFRDGAQAMRIINRHAAGDYATYRIERDGRQFELRVEILKVVNIAYLAQVLLGVGFLVVGTIVVMTRPQGRVQRMFARYSVLALLLFSLIDLNLSYSDPRWKIYLLVGGFVVARIFAAPMFVRFFLRFPAERPLLRSWKFTTALYAVSILCVLPFVLQPVLRLNQLVYNVLAPSPYAFFFGGLGVFAHSYFRRVDRKRRRQLRPILFSVIVGVLAIAYTVIIGVTRPFAIFLEPIILLPSLLIVSVPIAFGYSIFRYRLMDIDLLVKRSLIYGVITAAIAAIYLALVFGVGSLLGELVGQEENRLLAVVAFLIIAFLFDPLKRRVQSVVDRIFYRDRISYQKALLEFSQELPRLMELDQILASMVQRISSTMRVEQAAVVLCDGQHGGHCVSKGISVEHCDFRDEPGSLLALLRQTHVPQSFELLSFEPEHYPLIARDKQQLLAGGVVLTVPMFLQDRLVGMMAVGQKLSGKVYSQEDIDLLATVASQAAIAIENARLHRSELERHRIEEELALARKIQQGLLPKANPVIPGLEIAGVSIPAQTVGGDYYDFLQLSPTKVLVVVADVSGKGMSAALYMSKVQGMVQMAAHLYASPREILTHVNRRIFDGIERKSFITMILALFDLEKGEVTICRAGHNRALLGTNGNLEFLKGSGIGVGLEHGPVFEETLEEVRHPLKQGMLFFLYTDGLTETMNDRDEELGEDQVREMVLRHRGLHAPELQQAVIADTEEFRGSSEQRDDLTVVVVKVR